MVIISPPDGKEKKCNIHHVKPISPTTAFTSAFEEFQKSATKEGQKLNTVKPSQGTKYTDLHYSIAYTASPTSIITIVETQPHGNRQ